MAQRVGGRYFDVRGVLGVHSRRVMVSGSRVGRLLECFRMIPRMLRDFEQQYGILEDGKKPTLE